MTLSEYLKNDWQKTKEDYKKAEPYLTALAVLTPAAIAAYANIKGEFLKSSAFPWNVWAATNYGILFAGPYFEKHRDKIGKWIFWNVLNKVYSGSLKKELKRMNRDNIENKISE
jgi:hypothetical protein